MATANSTNPPVKSQAQRVVDRFGDSAAMIATTPYTGETIRNWLRAGTIPQKHHLQILIAARAAGVELSPADFYAHLVEALIAREVAQQTSTALVSA